MRLYPDKCHFMQQEVHKVGGEGISTVNQKVQVVTDWPIPANQIQLKSFLGLASYY